MSDVLKLFDFNGRTRPAGIVGKVMELGWPCTVYRITLPKPEEEGECEFNPFERCILKLLAIGRYEAVQLAEETCLPPDLVELILLKLRDRAKIDARNQLLPGVREALEKRDAERESAPATYETCAIFRECIGGTLLPTVVDAKMRSEEVNDDHTVGKGHVTIRSFAQSPIETRPPTPVEVLSALRAMSRRRKASHASYRIPPAQFVSVADGGENCWLRVRVVMQRNGDWRILDPFGSGWSPELETTYQDVLAKGRSAEVREFDAWQHRNRNLDGGHGTRLRDDKRESFATTENVSRYPELVAVLKRKRDGVADIDVYAVIEWALFYALGQTDVKRVVQLLGVRTREESQAWLKEARNVWRDEAAWRPKDDALARGICVVPSENGLQRFLDGRAAMQTVLPLAILVAERDPKCVFRRLAAECPRFLPMIADMKCRRDPKRHGKGLWREIYGEEDQQFMRRVVTTLLPSVRFSVDATMSPKAETECRAADDDARINARVAMQDLFGMSAFMRLDARLQDALVTAEILRHDLEGSREKSDVLDCVNELYRATQSAFRPFLAGGRQRPSDKESAGRRAAEAGFGPLPTAMRTVRESMLNRTLDGDDQTLQACVVAWLILADDDVLCRVASRMPSFLAAIDRLIVVDGHGNQRIAMSFPELDLLCKNVYKIIKTLTEA